MKRVKRGDLCLIGILLACAIGSLFFLGQKSGERVAVLYYEGTAVDTIFLDRVTESYHIEIGQTVVAVEPGRICFFSGCCPDHLCQNYGWLTKNGETMACVPEKIVIAIQNQKSAPDAVTG